MESRLSAFDAFLADIRSKTGVDVYPSPRGGEETSFRVGFGGSEREIYLAGTGEEAAREAKLIAYLLSDAPAAGSRKERLKSVLLGEGGRAQAFRYLAKYKMTDGACFAIDLIPEKRIADAMEHVERCLEGSDAAVLMDGSRIAVVKFTEDGQTPYEFGQFLNLSLYEETGVHARIGVGCEAESFTGIALSYEQAASANRMSGMLREKGEVHSYREYLLVRMLSEIPERQLEEYAVRLGVRGAENVFADEELTGTAEVFLESDLNLSETSRALFIHRNTLSYRLDKIERLTGLDIRKFSDAVTFRVMTILSKLLNSRGGIV